MAIVPEIEFPPGTWERDPPGGATKPGDDP
jgi:hypothetical protein